MVLLEKDLATVGLKGELRPFELHGLRLIFNRLVTQPVGNQGTYETHMKPETFCHKRSTECR